jgi:hypothetical protein
MKRAPFIPVEAISKNAPGIRSALGIVATSGIAIRLLSFVLNPRKVKEETVRQKP